MLAKYKGIIPSVKTVDQVNLTFRQSYDTNGRLQYYGEAAPGAVTSNSVWRISKRIYSGNKLSGQVWADGDTKFNKEWDERAGYTYVIDV